MLLSSIGPLESLSLSSCRCKWFAWGWANLKLWCKWCKWWFLFAPDALKSRGLWGDDDRSVSTPSRPKCNVALLPLPPRISVIIKRDLDGSTAIEPRCIGTVMPLTPLPFGDNNSAELVIVAVLVGLSPANFHCRTILTVFLPPSEYSERLDCFHGYALIASVNRQTL